MILRVFKGGKINKLLCLFFLPITLLLLAAAGVFALSKRPEVACVFCVIALITGAFSLFYGILWLIYSRKEKRQNWRSTTHSDDHTRLKILRGSCCFPENLSLTASSFP